MTPLAVSVRDLAVQYGRRLVFQDITFDIGAGQSLGVIGPNGSGKTTLLRTLAGCLVPKSGDIRIAGLTPRDALARTGVAYFAGDATLPGSVRASRWGGLGNGDVVYVSPDEVHQFRNPSPTEPFGFLCIVDAERDAPIPCRDATDSR